MQRDDGVRREVTRRVGHVLKGTWRTRHRAVPHRTVHVRAALYSNIRLHRPARTEAPTWSNVVWTNPEFDFAQLRYISYMVSPSGGRKVTHRDEPRTRWTRIRNNYEMCTEKIWWTRCSRDDHLWQNHLVWQPRQGNFILHLSNSRRAMGQIVRPTSAWQIFSHRK